MRSVDLRPSDSSHYILLREQFSDLEESVIRLHVTLDSYHCPIRAGSVLVFEFRLKN